MKKHQTQSLTVGLKCYATTQANSPCVFTPFKAYIDPIAQGNETDPGTRDAPLDNRDYCTVSENILRVQAIAYSPHQLPTASLLSEISAVKWIRLERRDKTKSRTLRL